MKTIYITGISGTGKTTIYDELKKRNFPAISLDEADDLCCWINKETGQKVTARATELDEIFTSKHDWICDVEHLKKLLDNETDKDLIFILGVASNQSQFIDLFDKVLLLQCKPDTFLHRLALRTNNDFGKDKTVQNAILGWYKNFENGLLQRGAISINTDEPIDEVVEDILKWANS